jgi:hypothetical protein
MNNNASCDNRVLGLLFGPSEAGLYGMSREVPWRFVARRTAVLSIGRHVPDGFDGLNDEGDSDYFDY